MRQERERAQRRALHGQHLRVAVDDGAGARGDGPLDVRRGDVLAKAHVDDLAAGGLDGVGDAGLALPKEDELVAQFLGVGQHGEQLRLRVAHHAHGAGHEHARRRAGDDVGRLVAGHLRDLAADGLLQVPDGDVFGSGVAHGGERFRFHARGAIGGHCVPCVDISLDFEPLIDVHGHTSLSHRYLAYQTVQCLSIKPGNFLSFFDVFPHFLFPAKVLLK